MQMNWTQLWLRFIMENHVRHWPSHVHEFDCPNRVLSWTKVNSSIDKEYGFKFLKILL